MLFVLVILYIYSGTVKLEQVPYPTPEACVEAGKAKLKVLEADPKMDAGLYIGCLPLPESNK